MIKLNFCSSKCNKNERITKLFFKKIVAKNIKLMLKTFFKN